MHHGHWDDALFVHYPVDVAALQRRLPPGLLVDEHDGVAYVSIVALTEAAIAPWPPRVPFWLVQWLGLSHHAVNVRTYVRPCSGDGPPGIFFFSLDCSGLLPTLGARALFNLPYRYASMKRRRVRDDGARSGQPGALISSMECRTRLTRAAFAADWVSSEECDADPLGRFLVERYALYNEAGCSAVGALRWMTRAAATATWSGRITHEPWPLRQAMLLSWSSSVLEVLGLDQLVLGEPTAHCSSGVRAIDFFWHGFVGASAHGEQSSEQREEPCT